MRALLRSREMGIALVLVAVVVLTTWRNPAFLFSSDGFRDLLLTPSILLVVVLGQGVVILTRNVDLSVGSVLGLTAYLVGTLFRAGVPTVLVIAAGLTLGALLGLINGALVALGRVPSMVITLGTLYAYRGLCVWWAGADRIDASELPPGFLRLGTQQILGLPVLTIISGLALAAVAWYLHNTRGGRECYAIGSDPEAAVLYGLDVRRRVLTAFVFSGLMAGLAGVLLAARYGTINSAAGDGFELEAVGAAVIGGIAITGGVGTIVGAALGAALLVTINRALPVLGIPDFWQRAVVGVLILGAIVMDRVMAVRQHRRRIEKRASS
ncbi:ABC transporter permease [Arachnia propionica]|uniref:Autoinducer 2 import system permease protein LsrC n=1 Tax=Arachnia propionica TaxID=1750 RepID=A0A3P1TAW0_9ACTN|nr:ABC transporter permease [Arachnia propionica]RRD06577.1 ABC transporter permease [Arachnia propionica]